MDLKLLMLIIGLLLCGAVYNIYEHEPLDAVVATSLALILILAMQIFRREDRRQLAFLNYLISEKAHIYSGQIIEEGIVMGPNTRLVQYEAVISFTIFYTKHVSRLYIKGSRSSRIYGLLYSFVTILFGWWSLPWGPVITMKTLFNNIRGQASMTVHDIIQFGGQPPKWKKQPKFHKAILKRDTDKVSNMLYKGTDPNTVDDEGVSALMRAAEFAEVEMVKMLLDHGADRTMVDAEGNTVLHRAAVNGKSDVVGLLLDYWSDPNATNEHGNTSLMMAASRGYTNVMQLLIERGAKLDLQNKKGISALMQAVDENELLAVSLLLQCGANQDLVNKWGRTAEQMLQGKGRS